MHDSRCKIMSKCNHVHKLSAAHVQLMQLSYCQSVMATARKSPAVLEHFIVPDIMPDGDFKAQCKYLEPPAKKSKMLFSYMPEQNTIPLQSSNVDDYLAAPCVSMKINPSNFRRENERKWPFLAKLAKEVLAVPSSSSPVERLFSIAGKVFRPERCKLSDSRFQILMFIRCNNNLKS